jgi:hypothetical protein
MKYENRVVAFIDVLGFRELIGSTILKDGNDNEHEINKIISTYLAIREIWDLDAKSTSLKREVITSKMVSIFSDSIVVSFEITDQSEVFSTLLEIKWLLMRLINQGILCRGAVSLGKLIHTEKYVFGPALVEAYTLESKAAVYPRVILERSIIEIGAKHGSPAHSTAEERKYVNDLLEKDSDGMYYVDYFHKAQSELDDPQYDFPEYIWKLGEIIRKGLMASSHSSKADIRVKYSWMRERFNHMIDMVKNENFITHLRNSGESDLAEFYSQVKKISPDRG